MEVFHVLMMYEDSGGTKNIFQVGNDVKAGVVLKKIALPPLLTRINWMH